MADRNFIGSGDVRRLLFRQSPTKRCDDVPSNGGFDIGNRGFTANTKACREVDSMEIYDLIIGIELVLKVEANDYEEATEKAGKWLRKKFEQSKHVENYEWEVLD